MTSYQADRDLLRDAALKAGELAMSYFQKNPNAWSKEGGSPVTEADMAVDAFLRTELLAARPDYGWLSEETVDVPAERQKDAIFVVDPIDGTRGFIEGDRRWCVSVAVVRETRPVAAALFAPALDEMYTAAAGEGAFLGDRRLAVPGKPGTDGARLAGPRGWFKSGTLEREGFLPQPHVPSLAYRVTMVASGAVESAFASPNAHDWDLAACDLLVHEAGGVLTTLDGSQLCYNRESVSHDAVAAANADLQPKVLAAIRRVTSERGRAGSRT
ncbi:myo-inositol-1(or 4)-monophosphatase [Faunimonas pinastri]|uniref:Myo-inositol-1(Or 4)-monophosphatase n=1 Tax=Faunimonas pinastri TaxID=1855383 RepID=A0A1H8ZLX9_9HYPH|nr:3'(2'),5'-bisphosphate nucleotidase CysQ [Faunimonas pinastri]SEP65271.1 myo-inositol-1(or 4)-monophosphatase [Faunimonas pinastri]